MAGLYAIHATERLKLLENPISNKKMKHIIDTTKLPSIPNCLKVDQHDTSLGEIDPTQIELYLDDEQKDTIIRGGQLREKLKGKPVLNATVLDYLYEHQKLIPVSWKDKTKDGYTQYIYFWGTIYRDSSGNLYVRYLYFFDGRWYSSYDRLR